MNRRNFKLSPQSAYLHIPFCHRRCFYCDFAVVPLGDKARGESGAGSKSIQSYLRLLHREIEISPKGPPLATIYIGGGTPSILAPYQIREIIQHLQCHFGIQYGAEISLEVDPASFSERNLDGYLQAGINRVSLGGQSFSDDVLKQLGRRHLRKDLIEACDLIHNQYINGGLLSWSLDLIQNAPGHDLKTWEDELNNAIGCSSPHISIYDLTIEKGTAFEKLQSRGKLFVPDDDLAAENMLLTTSKLSEAGLNRYEVSNFAKPGHSSRHNRVYWKGYGWWGYGLGATSSPWGERLSRPRTRDQYRIWIENQEREGLDSSLLSNRASSMDLFDKLIVGLRLREGVDLDLMSREWGWTSEQRDRHLSSLKCSLREFIDSGLILLRGRRMQLSNPDGMQLSNKVFVEILIWWESLPSDAVHVSKS